MAVNPYSFCVNGHEFTPENTVRVTRRGKPARECRTCRNASYRRYRDRNKDVVTARQRESNDKRAEEGYFQQRYQDAGYWSAIRRKYGVTREWYEATLAAQGGVCAVCGKDPEKSARRFAVDHDHASGEPRGVICKDCNNGLGHFRDNPDILMSAAAYLLVRTDILGKVK